MYKVCQIVIHDSWVIFFLLDKILLNFEVKFGAVGGFSDFRNVPRQR